MKTSSGLIRMIQMQSDRLIYIGGRARTILTYK